MIFHTVHCHSVADSLCLKSLVLAEYQLHGQLAGDMYIFQQDNAPAYRARSTAE